MKALNKIAVGIATILFTGIAYAKETKPYFPDQTECQIPVSSFSELAEKAVAKGGWTIPNYDALCQKLKNHNATIYIVANSQENDELQLSTGLYGLVDTKQLNRKTVLPAGELRQHIVYTKEHQDSEEFDHLMHRLVMDIAEKITDKDFADLLQTRKEFEKAKPDLNAKVKIDPNKLCVANKKIAPGPLKDQFDQYGDYVAEGDDFCQMLSDYNLQISLKPYFFKAEDSTVVMLLGLYIPNEFAASKLNFFLPYLNSRSEIVKGDMQTNGEEINTTLFMQAISMLSQGQKDLDEVVIENRKYLGLPKLKISGR